MFIIPLCVFACMGSCFAPQREEMCAFLADKLATWRCSRFMGALPVMLAAMPMPAVAADLGEADSDDEQGRSNGQGKRTNMTWLTRSDLTGLPAATTSNNPMVDDAIKKANKDVPEVTQVGAALVKAGQRGLRKGLVAQDHAACTVALV